MHNQTGFMQARAVEKKLTVRHLVLILDKRNKAGDFPSYQYKQPGAEPKSARHPAAKQIGGDLKWCAKE